MRNKDRPWLDDKCSHACGLKQRVHLPWTRDRSLVNWEVFVCCKMRANETYSEAKCLFIVRNRDVLMNDQLPHKWWSTFKSAVFGLSSPLPPLVDMCAGLVCESVSMADLLSDHFEVRSPGNLLICLTLATHLLDFFAFRSSECQGTGVLLI